MTPGHVALLVYLVLVLQAVVVLAVLRALARGWPAAIGPLLLAGAVALGVGGHLWWRKRHRRC